LIIEEGEAMLKVRQLVAAINKFAPWDLAYNWDQVGLQVGDGNQSVRKLLVAVDSEAATLAEALALKVDGILVHHPLIFKPITQIDPTRPVGKKLIDLIKNDLFLIAAHTNVDRARYGLNDYLGRQLGLEKLKILEKASADQSKVVLFTPENNLSKIRQAMVNAGGGEIGDYQECSFELVGNGRFRPQPGADPTIGKIGELETVAEVRLEMIVANRDLGAVMQAIRENHPYDTPAIDIYPLQNDSPHGLGRIGVLPQKITLLDFCELVKIKLGVEVLKVSGDLNRLIKRVAVATGSGASLIGKAISHGADLLVTGEIGYHDFQNCEAQDLAVIEVGHWTSEKGFIPLMSNYLKNYFDGVSDFQVIESTTIKAEPYKIF